MSLKLKQEEHQLHGHFDWLTPEKLAQAHEWWDIYTQSFPPAERDSKQQILLALQNKIARAGCYRIENRMTAIIVFYRLHTPAFAFLHYFAIAQSWRNKSLGSTLFPLIAQEAAKFVATTEKESLALIWEVEDPEAAETEKLKELQDKRISFYKKLGGKLFNTKFIQPGLNNHKPVAMQLMFHSAQTDLPEHTIARAIYFQKYQAINGIDTKELNHLLSLCHKETDKPTDKNCK